MTKLKILILFLFSLNAFSQQKEAAVTFVRDFIKSNSVTSNEMRLVRNWPVKDSADVKKLLVKRFDQFMGKGNEAVQLTEAEKNYVISKYVTSYNQAWLEKDFKPLLEFDKVLPYLQSDDNNTALIISHPIFLRNETVFFVSYTNLCCGELMGSNAELFYRKVNDQWEKWAFVQQGGY